MKINFQKILATVSAVAVMSCFAVPTFATDEPDGEWWGDGPWYDSSVDDNNEELENAVTIVTNYGELTDNISPFIESAIIILCVVSGVTIGVRFLKKSFR